MFKTVPHLFIIAFFVLITTLLVWLPHYLAIPNLLGLNFQQGFNTIYRNYDGLEYIVIAKTFYDPVQIAEIPASLNANYYAAHFPGFPLLISIFAPVLGYLKSMLMVSALFTIAASYAFYFLVRDFRFTNHPLPLTLVFLVLPARWIIVRSIGTSEPMFIFFVLVSIYFLLKALGDHLPIQKFIWISAIFASLAQFTRPPGNLLAFAYLIFVSIETFNLFKQNKFKYALHYFLSFYPFILVGITLLSVFYWYGIVYKDFWAYFHSGDNIHLTFPPFAMFNNNQYWVGSIWLEDIIYIFALGFLGGVLLLKQKLYPLGIFVLTYLAASVFVAHRDISRYTLPVVPFVIIAFEKILTSREFQIVLVILSLAIYLYSQNFILNNTSPIQNLSSYN